jgi:hypothetical protein
MIDELLEMILPGGAWLAAGIAIGAAFGTSLRPTAVRVMAAGLAAADRLQEAGAEAYEKAQDLMAEARHEREQRQTADSRPAPAARRRAARVESQ